MKIKADHETLKTARADLDDTLRRICHSFVGFQCSMACKDGLSKCDVEVRRGKRRVPGVKDRSIRWMLRWRPFLEKAAEEDQPLTLERRRL